MARVGDHDPVFLDTTVLVAGLVDFGAPSRAALLVFDALAAGHIRKPMTAWHCCLEFFSVVTRLPEVFRLDPDDARRLASEEILRRFTVVDLPSAEREPLLAAAVDTECSGGRVYDLHIATVARCAGARVLVTDNRRHFPAPLRGRLRVLSSDEFVAERRLDGR